MADTAAWRTLLGIVFVALSQIPAASAGQPLGSSPAVHEPRVKKRVTPKYPESARKAGLNGTVKMECVVGADGRVAGASVLHGEPPLSDAALDAVRKWRYEPLLFEGKPKQFVLTVTMMFAPVDRLTVAGLLESLSSEHVAVRESAATLLGDLRLGPFVEAKDLASARRELKALIGREHAERVLVTARDSLARLDARQ